MSLNPSYNTVSIFVKGNGCVSALVAGYVPLGALFEFRARLKVRIVVDDVGDGL